MRSRSRRRVALTLSCEAVDDPLSDPTEASCLSCREPLEFHQPDLDQPDRLIATCGDCKRWYLVEQAEQWPQGLLVLLPDARMLRTAFST